MTPPPKKPIKFTEARKAKWLAVYAEKGTVTAACRAVKIHPDTAYDHRQKDDAFRELWDRQENSVTEVLEKTLVEVVLDYDNAQQVRALEFALKARRPDRYRESVKLEHGGKITAQIDVGVTEAIQRFGAELADVARRVGIMAADAAPAANGRNAQRALAAAGESGADPAPG